MMLSMTVWIGGIIFFAFVVAPTVFSVLPTRAMAGMVVTRSLASLHWMGVVCGCVFLAASLLLSRSTRVSVILQDLLVVAMMVLTLASQLFVSARMETLRVAMGQIDSVPLSDPRRVAFNSLHQWSTTLEGSVLLLGLTALWFVARNFAVLFSAETRAIGNPSRSSSAIHS